MKGRGFRLQYYALVPLAQWIGGMWIAAVLIEGGLLVLLRRRRMLHIPGITAPANAASYAALVSLIGWIALTGWFTTRQGG